MPNLSLIEVWLKQKRVESQLQVQQICFDACGGWKLTEGKLTHNSGGFFSIVGLKYWAAANPNTVNYAPYIDQFEIGLLGFVIRMGKDGVEFLLQAKTEPGNVGGTQLAPTVQATRSNYKMLHGGRPTRFFELFQDPSRFLSDRANSEQGTHFLLKFNRNAIVAVPYQMSPIVEGEGLWRWASSGEVRHLLGTSFVMNTDARSVIASAPWALVANGDRLFQSDLLQTSYSARPTSNISKYRRSQLNFKRMGWDFLPVDNLPGWTLDDGGICAQNGDYRVSYYDISVEGREISTWCQPLVRQSDLGEHVLLAQIRDGVLHVFVRYCEEPGFGGRCELGPSLSTSYPTPHRLSLLLAGNAKTLISEIEQSDEGGRFMLVNSRYKISLLRGLKGPQFYGFGMWINLAALEQLANLSGATTNELRTLVSLLLSRKTDSNCKTLIA